MLVQPAAPDRGRGKELVEEKRLHPELPHPQSCTQSCTQSSSICPIPRAAPRAPQVSPGREGALSTHGVLSTPAGSDKQPEHVFQSHRFQWDLCGPRLKHLLHHSPELSTQTHTRTFLPRCKILGNPEYSWSYSETPICVSSGSNPGSVLCSLNTK